MGLLAPARETLDSRSTLRMLADELPDELIAEVLDFAEFFKQKQQRSLASTDSGTP